MPQIPKIFKVAFLLITTASAMACIASLFSSDIAFVPSTVPLLLAVGSCISVLTFWKESQRNLRIPLSCLGSIFVIFAGLRFLDVSWERLEDSPQAVTRRIKYESLEDAIRSQNIGQVQAALKGYANLDRTPDVMNDGQDSCSIRASYCPGEKPLRMAVDFENLPVAKLLLDHGASPADVDTFAEAALPGHAAMMKLLIHRGALNGHGDTHKELLRRALWNTVKFQEVDMVAFLLHQGADPNSSEPDDNTARTGAMYSLLELAQSFGDKSIAKMLKQAGAKE